MTTAASPSVSPSAHPAPVAPSVHPAPVDAGLLGPLLDRLIRRHAVPGAQLAVTHRGVTSVVTAGEELFGGGQPVTPESRFPLGSLTKPFTATLLMTLVDEGEIEPDEPLGEQFPELAPVVGAFGSLLTLRHLLSHTGGLPGSHPAARPPADRARYVRDACAQGPLSPPGTAFSYSNIGPVAAGLVAELVLGMDWEEAVDSVLCRPLGLRPVFVTAPGAAAHHVSGHAAAPRLGTARPVAQLLPPVEAPSGGLALSAPDLLRFGTLFADAPVRPLAPLLPAPRITEGMRRVQPHTDAFGLADAWGLGPAHYLAAGGGTWVGHDGTGDGTSCHLRIEPREGTGVALTTNAGTGLALWDDLVAELGEAGFDVASHPFTRLRGEVPEAPDEVLERCLGTYRNGATEYRLVRDSEGVRLDQGGRPFARLAVRADLTFSVIELTTERTCYVGRFVESAGTGRIDRLQISGRLAVRSGRAA
ncbi:serine hydrolase domain-containing protein [Streptomyces sp. NPDC004111]|uniref:serine hydrolase domain-containing protein n=1 Tax=Streptomyces sp. NPDC004111 TaxID=3364690 RepID=UPI0036C56D25